MKTNSMKPITTLLLALTVCIATSCSKSESEKSAGASSKTETLPESEVVDIVNAVSAKDVAKVTAMLQANPKLVKAKFTAGGPVSGWPLLMIAAKEGSKPLVELLLSSGADVNEKNYSSEVALHYAALKGHKDIVQILLDHKADVNVKNDADATPLAAASSDGKPDIIALLKQHGAKE
jgi:ankyrin repeat protein